MARNVPEKIISTIFNGVKKHPVFSVVAVVVFAAVAIRVGVNNLGAESVQSVSADATNFPTVTLLNVSDYRHDGGTVSAKGIVESLQQADLRSQFTGQVVSIQAGIGDTVRAGDTLVTLGSADVAAQLMQVQALADSAQAVLDGLRRGTRPEELQLAQTQVSNLEVSLANAERDYQNATDKAGSDLRGAYANAVASLQTSVSVLDNALTQADNILGVDNTGANDTFESVLAANNHIAMFTALQDYSAVKAAINSIRTGVSGLTTSSTPAAIDGFLASMEEALGEGNQLLRSVIDVLNATPLVGTMTQASLDAKKSTIESVRVGPISVNAQYTTIVALRQAIATQQKVNTSIVAAAQSRVDETRNALTLAQQQLTLKQAGATSEQIRAQEAQLAQARASVASVQALLQKTIIRAPIDGEVASLDARLGELVTAGQPVATIVNTGGLQVKGYVSDKDFLRIAEGNPVAIEGGAKGTVSRLAPSIDLQTKQVEVNVAVIAPQEAHLVVGQNVQLMISTNDQAAGGAATYILPLQAVRIATDGGAYVLTVNAQSEVEENPVVLGELSGESVAVTKGLSDGREIISAVFELKAGEKVEVIR
ncbi:MAG: efflux RND transporter periplasmic adaptor subunit [Patescibacteria group bacterium]|nr:efflux RND transporter periplasmic adaptor subunit [Patescibacteria group bacterium]